MTETYATTAERELSELLGWLQSEPVPENRQTVIAELTRRLTRIEGSHDGWRARCLSAEKKLAEAHMELTRMRDELMDLKHKETVDGT